jgi:roadblock/LC7 domain-containing protein
MTTPVPHDKQDQPAHHDSGPLEEQRDALLARIHASRDSYRQQMQAVDAGKPTQSMKQMMNDPEAHPFPRSQTMRWLLGHPWLIAGGVAAVAVIGPRRAVNGIARVGPLVSTAATMITMTLQDPARMRMVTRGITSLATMVRSRR